MSANLQIFENGDESPDTGSREVVITGVGMVSPIGIGREDFWKALCEGRSGVGPMQSFDASKLPVSIAAEVAEFEPKKFVRPRKSLKVMSRDIQFGFTAADLAFQDAGLKEADFDPERMGVVFGADMIYCDLEGVLDAYQHCLVDGKFQFNRWGSKALGSMYPLWMLKFLPNMPACHIGIALDARGPNNSVTLTEVSSLLAMSEAVRVIERGQADVMISGGASSRIHPTSMAFRANCELSRRCDDPAAASRPFDAARDGKVNGEGAGGLILEARHTAEARGANILARVLGYSSTFEPHCEDRPNSGQALRRSIEIALASADLKPSDIGHVNAHGMSTPDADRLEAQAIRDTLGDVPVTGLKSYFGSLGAGGGAVEMIASVLSFGADEVPRTLNYEQSDPECPVEVIHGTSLRGAKKAALVLNQASTGQAVAMVIAAP